MNEKLQNKIPGLTLALITGLLAYYLTKGLEPIIPKKFNWGIPIELFPLDTLVVGIVLGIIIRAIVGERQILEAGLRFAPKLFIPIGIICYGTKMRFHKLLNVPTIAWLQVLVGIFCVFAVITYLGKKLNVNKETNFLIAVGTAICGASAIAIITPVIKGKGEDMSISLLVITVWGLIGMLLFPLLQGILNLSMEAYALFCATALHQTGLVKAASSQFLNAGKACQQLALSIKMVRTAMIIPIAAILAWVVNTSSSIDQKDQQPVFKCIPWFMYIFVVTGILFSVPAIHSYTNLVSFMKIISGLTFTIALTSIGLTVNLMQIIPIAGKPLLIGLCGWLAAIMVFLAGHFTGAII